MDFLTERRVLPSPPLNGKSVAKRLTNKVTGWQFSLTRAIEPFPKDPLGELKIFMAKFGQKQIPSSNDHHIPTRSRFLPFSLSPLILAMSLTHVNVKPLYITPFPANCVFNYSKFNWLFVTPLAPFADKSVRCAF